MKCFREVDEQEPRESRKRKKKAGEKRKWDMFDEDMKYDEEFSRYIMSCKYYKKMRPVL